MTKQQLSEIDLVFKKAEELRESDKSHEALQEYSKVIFYAPKHWPSYFHMAGLLGKSGHNALAVSLLKRALALNPENRVIHNHLADYLVKVGETELALEHLKESWRLEPTEQNISALFKIGKQLWLSNRPAKALYYLDLLLEKGEDHENFKENIDIRHLGQWYLALCKMSLGDYQNAWDDYESRVNIPGVFSPELKGEQWLGQALKNKIIFFAYEQRFGDIIQFMRFIPRIEAMDAKVIVQTPPELIRQFEFSFPNIEIISTKKPIPNYDYYQWLTSVPSVLNLTKEEALTDPVPYFDIADSDKTFKLPMRKETVLKVGLVWEGKPDPDRSIPLSEYIPLLEHREVSFYSFQLGEQRKHLNENSVSWLIHDLSPKISDFYDSSVLLKDIDLLITIDTAIAHQAGALGVPVWLMLKHFSDWRWELNRDDNPWYPSMRLFRQSKVDSWKEASKELENAFREWVLKSIELKKVSA